MARAFGKRIIKISQVTGMLASMSRIKSMGMESFIGSLVTSTRAII